MKKILLTLVASLATLTMVGCGSPDETMTALQKALENENLQFVVGENSGTLEDLSVNSQESLSLTTYLASNTLDASLNTALLNAVDEGYSVSFMNDEFIPAEEEEEEVTPILDEESQSRVEFFYAKVDTLLETGKTFESSTVSESDLEGYSFLYIYTIGEVDYKIYFNEPTNDCSCDATVDVEGDEDNPVEKEEESDVEEGAKETNNDGEEDDETPYFQTGLMVVGDQEFDIVIRTLKEDDETNFEIKTTEKDNPDNFVRIRVSKEIDEDGEYKNKYHQHSEINGVSEDTYYMFKIEDGETIAKLRFKSEDKTYSVSFKQEVDELGVEFTKIRYQSGLESGMLFVYKTFDENGEEVLEYKFFENGKYRKDTVDRDDFEDRNNGKIRGRRDKWQERKDELGNEENQNEQVERFTEFLTNFETRVQSVIDSEDLTLEEKVYKLQEYREHLEEVLDEKFDDLKENDSNEQLTEVLETRLNTILDNFDEYFDEIEVFDDETDEDGVTEPTEPPVSIDEIDESTRLFIGELEKEGARIRELLYSDEVGQVKLEEVNALLEKIELHQNDLESFIQSYTSIHGHDHKVFGAKTAYETLDRLEDYLEEWVESYEDKGQL